MSRHTELGAAPSLVSTNTYSWTTFAERDGGTFRLPSDDALAAIASAGLNARIVELRRPLQVNR